MQARADRIFKNLQDLANDDREEDSTTIKALKDRIAQLDCNNLPLPAQQMGHSCWSQPFFWRWKTA